MQKNKSTIQIINYIIQKQCKKHNSCFIKTISNIQIKLLNFLWINKLIYGYKRINVKYYVLFFKNRIRNNKKIYNKYNKMLNTRTLIKLKVWNTNNLFIINNNKNFFNIKQINLLKIGGFISYKIT